MNLEEGLAELRENLLRDNAQLASGPDDKLWSDETLVRYVTDAERRWARLTLTLRDHTTPEVCEVELESGITEYTLHKSVRAVISARYDTNTWDLWRAGHALLNRTTMDDDCPFTVNQVMQESGAPRAFTTDESLDLDEDSSVILRVFGTPTDDEEGKIIHLRVARMPMCRLSIDTPDQKFEIPDEFCLDMLEWAAYRAKRTSDLDGASDQAKDHKARFEEAAGEQLKVNRTKLHAPIRFGFGGGWER